MSEKLELIPFHSLGGLQNRGESVNAAIEENFTQIYKAINDINERNQTVEETIKPKLGRPKKESY